MPRRMCGERPRRAAPLTWRTSRLGRSAGRPLPLGASNLGHANAPLPLVERLGLAGRKSPSPSGRGVGVRGERAVPRSPLTRRASRLGRSARRPLPLGEGKYGRARAALLLRWASPRWLPKSRSPAGSGVGDWTGRSAQTARVLRPLDPHTLSRWERASAGEPGPLSCFDGRRPSGCQKASLPLGAELG